MKKYKQTNSPMNFLWYTNRRVYEFESATSRNLYFCKKCMDNGPKEKVPAVN